MAESSPSDSSKSFELIEPARSQAPLIFNSPHSGSDYPSSFLAISRLDQRTIRQSEDIHVDQLFIAAVDNGAFLLRAHFPRAWLDVNREPFELDPKMFVGSLPSFANTRSTRVASGLGTIPRVVADGKAIYTVPLAIVDALSRIEQAYVPYHRALRRLIDRTRAAYGFSVLIDCHSMPSTVRPAGLRGRPDFVLGDRHGTSCTAALTELTEAVLVRRGYDVARNRPYAGGFITEHYGRPTEGVHAIQIEINRALYLNEQTLRKTKGFAPLQADLAVLIGELAHSCGDLVSEPREAAE